MKAHEKPGNETGGAVVCLLILVNGIVLQQSLIGDADGYKVLFVSVPLLMVALFQRFRPH